MSVNKQIIIGRLGGDPELRTTAGGNSVANFSVATDHKWNEEKTTTWHKVIVFGKTAEACMEHLSKGMQVYVEGRTQHRKWEDRDGNTRYSTEVVAERVNFLEWKDDGQKSKPRGDSRQDQQAARGRSYGRNTPAPNDDNLPF